MLSFENFEDLLFKKFAKKFSLYNNEKYIGVVINTDNIFSLIKYIKDHTKLNFHQLIDITVIDYPARELRFNIVYILQSLRLNARVVVKAFLNENTTLESITSLYKSANWYERECYDLFGIKFVNHPDLRRIMTDYNFDGHPLRKDFPLTGHTEVRYDNLEKRVIYEPVNLAQEYRDFDYSSPWEGMKYEFESNDKNKNNIKK